MDNSESKNRAFALAVRQGFLHIVSYCANPTNLVGAPSEQVRMMNAIRSGLLEIVDVIESEYGLIRRK